MAKENYRTNKGKQGAGPGPSTSAPTMGRFQPQTSGAPAPTFGPANRRQSSTSESTIVYASGAAIDTNNSRPDPDTILYDEDTPAGHFDQEDTLVSG